MMRTRWLLGLAGLVGLLGGCGDSSTSSPDLATGPVCMAGAKDCVSDRIARVCASDGTWIPVQCRAGELCTDGACAADPNAACTSASDTCMNDTTALRCSASAMGFDVVLCPAGTTCAGAGLCQGVCVVGSSRCAADGSVEKCIDGKGYTTVACAANERCVQTASTPYETAACKPAECTPATNGCDLVCGKKADPTAPGQEGWMSLCQETPSGYKWVGIQCNPGQSCSPTGGTCTGGTQADCASECHPGDTRCVSLAGGSGNSAIQTCGPDGTWSATVTSCNPDPTNGGKVCFGKPGDTAHVVCGDAACSKAAGACDNDGSFRACDGNGNIGTDGAACATGVCTQIGFVDGSWQPGACLPQCVAGAESCIGGGSYHACTANLTWGPTQNCPDTAAACLDYTSQAGIPAKACGDCVPGTTRCTDENGNDGNTYVQTCAADATWGTPAACTMGSCVPAGSSEDEVACVVECIPGKEVCVGDPASLPGLVYEGTDSHVVCGDDGKLGPSTACDAGTICRKGATGNSLGCVACVGGDNEFGLVDTRCADSMGNAGGNYVQTCKSDSSGWQGIATLVQCVDSGCSDPTTDIPIPTASSYCEMVFFGPSIGEQPLTESNLAKLGLHCDGAPVNGGAPISCGLESGGTVPDCCTTACLTPDSPLPAMCID